MKKYISKSKIKLETSQGEATLESLWISDLGYVMAKMYYKKDGTFINYKVSTVEELLIGKKI